MSLNSPSEIEQRQYEAWGIVVQQQNVQSAHIVNGLVQLLRVVESLPPYGSLRRGSISYPSVFSKMVTTRLSERFGAGKWQLSEEARAFCITQDKNGPLPLDDFGRWQEGEVPTVVTAGRARVAQRLNHPGDGGLPASIHSVISAALNPDQRVKIKGAHDPTCPGLWLAGYTSTHTLKPMHAATFLGLLGATSAGREALATIYRWFADSSDPVAELVHILDVGLDLGTTHLEPDSFAGRFPLPSDGAGWPELATVTAFLACNLVSWAEVRGAGLAEARMALLDLASLILMLRMLRWETDEREARALLLVSPASRASTRGVAFDYGRRSMQGAAASLDQQAVELGMVKKRWLPWPAARNLGAATGWLYPRFAQGGARHFLSPGPRQLTTLVHALLRPGEDLSWGDFHRRALDSLGIVLGGFDEVRASRKMGFSGAAAAVRLTGAVNQGHLIQLGLGRQESDNVVFVDGGAA